MAGIQVAKGEREEFLHHLNELHYPYTEEAVTQPTVCSSDSEPSMNRRFPALAVLRHGAFARFAFCRFFTTLSWQMLGVAVGWRVYALTHDALSLGLVGLSEFLPFTCLILVGGHIADRLPRHRVLLATWSIETLCIGALVIWTALGMTAVWPIYLAVGIFGGTRAFWAPAMQAMVPNLVPREEFPRALAVNSTLFQVSVILGPGARRRALSIRRGRGIRRMPGTVPGHGGFVAVPCTEGVADSSATDSSAASRVARVYESRGHVFLEGLRYVLHQRMVLGLISLDLFAVLFGGATALLPIFAGDVLHIGPAGLGLLRSAPGVGGGDHRRAADSAADRSTCRLVHVRRCRAIWDMHRGIRRIPQLSDIAGCAVHHGRCGYGECLRARHPGAAQYTG